MRSADRNEDVSVAMAVPAVMAEAVRQRYRPFDMQDLGREVKRREADYRSGRASLRALRDAIARGTRPDVLLRDSRSVVVERPAAARPATDRPERTTPIDRPQRPERPVERHTGQTTGPPTRPWA